MLNRAKTKTVTASVSQAAVASPFPLPDMASRTLKMPMMMEKIEKKISVPVYHKKRRRSSCCRSFSSSESNSLAKAEVSRGLSTCSLYGNPGAAFPICSGFLRNIEEPSYPYINILLTITYDDPSAIRAGLP